MVIIDKTSNMPGSRTHNNTQSNRNQPEDGQHSPPVDYETESDGETLSDSSEHSSSTSSGEIYLPGEDEVLFDSDSSDTLQFSSSWIADSDDVSEYDDEQVDMRMSLLPLLPSITEDLNSGPLPDADALTNFRQLFADRLRMHRSYLQQNANIAPQDDKCLAELHDQFCRLHSDFVRAKLDLSRARQAIKQATDRADRLNQLRNHPASSQGSSTGTRSRSSVPASSSSKASDKCVICIDRDIDAVSTSCGHLVACSCCLKDIKKCPICRAKVSRILRLFRI